MELPSTKNTKDATKICSIFLKEKISDSLSKWRQAPDQYKGGELDNDEDHVQSKQQTVNDQRNHSPLLRGFTPLGLNVYQEADGKEFPAQPPQLLHDWIHRWFHCRGSNLKVSRRRDAGSYCCGVSRINDKFRIMLSFDLMKSFSVVVMK